MLLILLISTPVLLTVTAQQNLTGFGQATQSSTDTWGVAKNAIMPPISNSWDIRKCTHTKLGSNPAWWMFTFSLESLYITDITIYYREDFSRRMDGFKLYITNTSTIPPTDHLCYADPDPGEPNTTQTIPCYELGKYVIYYDDKGSTESNGRVDGPVIELCYVAINGCQKSRWGSTCQYLCVENCIEGHCYPRNGSCVWGCKADNCLNDICNKDTAVCTDGCKEKRTGRYCNKYNIASDGLVWQVPSGSTDAGLAIDGIETTCAKTKGTNVRFHVDLKEKSIVTGLYIILAEAISTTNGSQSQCTATATPRPTREESVWMRALDRHHANLQNNEQTCPVADDAEGTDRNATSPGPSISASSQSKRSSSSCSIQQTPSKKKKTAEDVYTLQCAVLEKELEKNTLQVDLLRKLLSKYDSLDSDALEILSVLGQ